jgi:hypothetical protein
MTRNKGDLRRGRERGGAEVQPADCTREGGGAAPELHPTGVSTLVAPPIRVLRLSYLRSARACPPEEPTPGAYHLMVVGSTKCRGPGSSLI